MTQNPNQRLFNDAYQGLEAQGFEQCLNQTKTLCCYNGPDGTHCAIGWCIDVPERLQFQPTTNPEVTSLLLEKYPGVDPLLALELQDAHDNESAPKALKLALTQVAIDYNLEVPK